MSIFIIKLETSGLNLFAKCSLAGAGVVARHDGIDQYTVCTSGMAVSVYQETHAQWRRLCT